MTDIPKESPDRRKPHRFASQPSYVDPVAWAAIGFAIGTLAAAPFILSPDLRDKLQGGAIFGGSLGTLIGWAYGMKRLRKSRQNRAISESKTAETCPMCGSPTKANVTRCLSCGESFVEPPFELPAPRKTIPSAVGFAILLAMLVVILLIHTLRR
jgi:hypothetical protein